MNKGILLLVLVFALISTLIVAILTLFRWIVYSFQARKYKTRDHEWSFTKIEEQQKLKENDVIEEAIELEESPSPTQHYESLAITSCTTTEVEVATPCNHAKKDVEQEPLLEAKLPVHATEGKPPTQAT